MANLNNVNEELKKKREARRIAETIYDAIICDPNIKDDMMNEVVECLLQELYLYQRTCAELDRPKVLSGEEIINIV